MAATDQRPFDNHSAWSLGGAEATFRYSTHCFVPVAEKSSSSSEAVPSPPCGAGSHLMKESITSPGWTRSAWKFCWRLTGYSSHHARYRATPARHSDSLPAWNSGLAAVPSPDPAQLDTAESFPDGQLTFGSTRRPQPAETRLRSRRRPMSSHARPGINDLCACRSGALLGNDERRQDHPGSQTQHSNEGSTPPVPIAHPTPPSIRATPKFPATREKRVAALASQGRKATPGVRTEPRKSLLTPRSPGARAAVGSDKGSARGRQLVRSGSTAPWTVWRHGAGSLVWGGPYLGRRHPESSHDPPGGNVFRHVDAHHLGKAKYGESVFEAGGCTLGRQSTAPVVRVEPPTDLDRRHHFGKKPGCFQTDVPDEDPRLLHLDGPCAVVLLLLKSEPLIEKLLRLPTGESSAEGESPHLGFGKDLRQCFHIIGLPGTDPEAVGENVVHHHPILALATLMALTVVTWSRTSWDVDTLSMHGLLGSPDHPG